VAFASASLALDVAACSSATPRAAASRNATSPSETKNSHSSHKIAPPAGDAMPLYTSVRVSFEHFTPARSNTDEKPASSRPALAVTYSAATPKSANR